MPTNIGEYLAHDFWADVPIDEARGSLLGSVLRCLNCRQTMGPVYDRYQAAQMMAAHRFGAHPQLGQIPKIGPNNRLAHFPVEPFVARNAAPEKRPCAVESCGYSARRNSRWCKQHHARKLTHGDVLADVPLDQPKHNVGRPRTNVGDCAVEGCDKPAMTRGWCNAHYRRWKSTGDVRADLPIRVAS